MKFLQLLSSFLECEALITSLSIWFGIFNKSCRQRTQLIFRKMKVLITKIFQSHFKVTLGTWTIKNQHGEIPFLKMEGNIAKHFNLLSNQSFGKSWRRNRSSNKPSGERINFYCNHKEADTKIFAFIKFFCDNIRLNRVITVLSDSDVAVIFLYQSVTNLTFLDALWSTTGTGDDQRYIPIHVLASESGLPIWCCLLPAMHAGCDSVSSFSHIRKMTTLQTLNNKIDELINMIDFGDFPHSL